MKILNKNYNLRLLAYTLLLSFFVVACSDDSSPTGDFTYIANDLSITFSATGTNGISVTWDFGDEGTSTAFRPTHTYAEAGDYTVTLTVLGKDGTNAVVSKTVTVTAPTYQPITVVNGDFELPGGADAIVSWDINEEFGDVPGWSSVNDLDNCGVFLYSIEGITDKGDPDNYFGKNRHQDGPIYNLTDHVIAEGEQFKLSVDIAGLWYGDGEIRLYYDTGDGTRNVIGSKPYTPWFDAGQQDKVWVNYELTVVADAAAAGSKIGIEIDNTGNDGSDGWSAIDNVMLWVK